MGNPNEIKGHREAPNIKGCLLLIIGIKCEIKGVARQPLWEECNCNLEASEFFAETHLDKSRLRKKSWKSMPVSMDIAISNSMLMTASQVRPSTAQAFSR